MIVFFSLTVPVGKIFFPHVCKAQEPKLNGLVHLCTQIFVLTLLGIIMDL